MSSATTAKPSTLERSKDGTSTGETTSAASTRPSAASRATRSTPRGVRSTAARNRRSASSRSTTCRNCSCSRTSESLAKGGSRIEPDVDVRPAAKPSLSSPTTTKPSARVVDERTEAPATDSGSTRPSVEPDARVIEAPDRRADLARQRRADRAVRPRLRSAAERANGAAGKEVVRAERRDGVARQQEDEPRADPAQAGRTARAHRDAVHRQLAVRRHERGREVLDADARSAGHDDDVGIRMQRGENGVAASSRTSPGKSTVAPSRSASAASIGPFASAI